MANTILILDDDADILFFCTYVFEDLGFKVIASKNCENIEDQVRKANPDIMLIDNWIPDIGGVKATQILKANTEFNHIPIILFSANSQLQQLALEAGADSYLRKPFDLDELEKIVQQFLSERT